MAWEEDWLLPQIEDGERTPLATQFIRFDHRQIAQQAARLHLHTLADGGPTSGEARTLVADLTGLAALLRANLEREEQFLLPLLEREGRSLDTGVAGLTAAGQAARGVASSTSRITSMMPPSESPNVIA